MARHPERDAARARTVTGLRLPAVAFALVASAALAGCTNAGPVAPSASASDGPSTPGASASGTPSPSQTAASALDPEASAADNLPYFTSVVEAVWASADRAAGRAYIDALVEAGFEKSAMQVTNDTSTVGNPAESIQFAVRWEDQCLVGQVGSATGDPYTVVVPVLPEGTCLVGATRPIDW